MKRLKHLKHVKHLADSGEQTHQDAAAQHKGRSICFWLSLLNISAYMSPVKPKPDRKQL